LESEKGLINVDWRKLALMAFACTICASKMKNGD